MRSLSRITGMLLVLLVAAGCGVVAGAGQQPTLTVFAAASLANAFDAVSAGFSAQSGINVTVAYAGSQELVTQLNEGAPVDVIALASTATMDAAVAGGRVTAAAVQPFAGNRLVLVVNPVVSGAVSGLADLATGSVTLVLADAAVPAGAYARELLERAQRDPAYGADFGARVLANVVSFEPNVRAVLRRVELGEAAAGIVYASDAAAAGAAVTTIALPDTLNPPIRYPIAAVSDSRSADAAAQFVAYVLSPAGQQLLADAGFLPAER